MSQYSRVKEDAAEKILTDMGFILVEDTARRHTGQGDRVLYHPDLKVGLCIDHKSTKNEKGIRIERSWFEKIAGEAPRGAIPLMTFSLYNDRELYFAGRLKDILPFIAENAKE